MTLLDRAPLQPGPDDRPIRVQLPAPLTRPSAAGTPAAAPCAPRSPVITLTSRDAVDLPLRLPRLLAEHDVRTGDRVTVDLADVGSVHVTGLELLLTVLWRRVGLQGDVQLVGGSRGLRAQLRSLGVSPLTCRAAVHGPGHAPDAVPAPLGATVPAVPALPAQRHWSRSGRAAEGPAEQQVVRLGAH